MEYQRVSCLQANERAKAYHPLDRKCMCLMGCCLLIGCEVPEPGLLGLGVPFGTEHSTITCQHFDQYDLSASPMLTAERSAFVQG